jgi:hypothetical protein
MAIVCDGAGSAKNSQLGSEFIAKIAAPKIFKESLTRFDLYSANSWPTEEKWNEIVNENVRKLQDELVAHAKGLSLDPSSLACTFIIVICSPVGILAAHVGDGRAGYCDRDGIWKPLIKPHKGDEANMTIFMTSNLHMVDKYFLMSGVRVPESRVINEKATAFALMSDGCETHSFQCSIPDLKTGKFYDPNLPYPKFFNPLTKNLRDLLDDQVQVEEANEKWKKFIECGTKGLENEPDDKTMILGILIG